MADKTKYCPWIRQVCIKDQCDFFNESVKKCQVSVISYNMFKLSDAFKDKTANGSNKGIGEYEKSKGTEIPFPGMAS